MKLNLVGKIIATHGIKGEVKVKSDTSFDRFKVGNILYVKINDKFEPIEINSHRVHKNHDLITFNNITDINDVLKYINCDVYVDIENLDELDENEYYYDDLIGLKVKDEGNNLIGEILDLREVPQGVLLEVKKINGKIALVPFVDEFIISIDIENNEMIIRPIEGLL